MPFGNPNNLIEANTLTAEDDGRTRIGIAIVRRNEQFLVGKRDKDAVLGGLSEFPGGKCEVDEAPTDCAVRECFEETGLRVQVVEELPVRCHEYAHGSLELHFFICALAAGENQQPIGSFRWVERSELGGLNFPEANAEIVSSLL
jgi:mutator protein MutT